MSSRPHLPSTAALVAVVLTIVLASGVTPSSGQEQGAEPSSPTVTDAEAALTTAEDVQGTLSEQLAALQQERARMVKDLGDRDGRLDRATRDLRRARTGAQSLAVLAYITADGAAAGIGTAPGADDIYAATLVTDGAEARRSAASYYRDLRRQADDAVTATVTQLDELDGRIDDLRRELDLATDDVRGAATELEEAQAAERARDEAIGLASLPATPSGSPNDGGWTPIGTVPGGPTPQQWAQLRNCESSGNYQAVSSGGTYRGAYQFDLSTWRTVGGQGDPIAASPAEQDHRAQLLWQSRGSSPWPVCGRYLR